MPKYILQKIKLVTNVDKKGSMFPNKIKEKELKAASWGEAHEIEKEKAAGWGEKYFSHVKEI